MITAVFKTRDGGLYWLRISGLSGYYEKNRNII